MHNCHLWAIALQEQLIVGEYSWLRTEFVIRRKLAFNALETGVHLLITPGILFYLSAYVTCIEEQLQVIQAC